MAITLYNHPLASFCHKVRIALYELGTGFDKRLKRAALATAYRMIEERTSTRQSIAATLSAWPIAPPRRRCSMRPRLSRFPPVRVIEKYFERLVARPSVRRVLEDATAYFSIDPFAEAIPARFR